MTIQDEKIAKLTKAFEDLLRSIGQSPGKNPGLLETPVNTATMWVEDMMDGYEREPADILAGGTDAEDNAGLVVVRDIFFHSVCPHHLLPFHGVAHVGYIPGRRIVGLSKLGRLVDCFAHRLLLQEEIGNLITAALIEHLGAIGAACRLDSEQLCMVIRGVRKPGSRAVTTGYAGTMRTDQSAQMAFLSSISPKTPITE